MAQTAKIDVRAEIKSPAERFYEIFKRKAYLLPKICPKMIKDIQVLRGDWETVGSVKQWTYYGAGTSVEKGSEKVKAIDEEKGSITFEVLEGELMNFYETFTSTMEVMQKKNSKGSSVKWTLEYQKLNDQVPPPYMYLDFVTTMTNHVDEFLLHGL